MTRLVGRYEVLHEIGRGGMATVHLAPQPELDRLIALKEMTVVHADREALAKRCVRESRLAGSLSHPGIVTVFDSFEYDGTPFIAMERAREDHRLRRRQGDSDLLDRAHRRRHDRRHARLHGARAGDGRARRPVDRPVRPAARYDAAAGGARRGSDRSCGGRAGRVPARAQPPSRPGVPGDADTGAASAAPGRGRGAGPEGAGAAGAPDRDRRRGARPDRDRGRAGRRGLATAGGYRLGP